MAEPNLTEVVATVLRNRAKEFADNISNNNALLQRLNKRGKIKTVSGGRTIIQDLEYAENATFKYYSGYEALDITPSKVFDAAEFTWKQAACTVSWSGLEVDVQASGPEALIDLIDGRTKNAIRTLANNLSVGIYSDGTGTSGKQIGGLQLIVADAPATGTVGGINRANFSFWRNKYYDFSSASVTATSTTIQAAMRTLWIAVVRGTDKPDIIVAGSTYFGFFWASLTTIQRITREDRGVAGFSNLAWLDADVVYDGDATGGLGATRMYMLNTNYLHWRPHKSRNVVPLVKRMATNQDATVLPIVWAGNLTASNCARQGVITA